MTSLVILKDKDIVTTSKIIAEGVELDHESVLKLIRKYENELKQFGDIGFEIRKSGGRPGTVYFLNEQQTTLLIALMKNSKIVLSFKISLVKEFFKMRKSLIDAQIRQNNQDWIETRKEGKTTRLQETDTIKEFTDYCRNAGSKNADTYYWSLTNVPYKALFLMEQKFKDMRNLLTGQQLMVLMTAEQVVTKALKDGMKSEMEYHEIFQMAKDRVETFASVLPKTPVVMLNEIKPF